VAGSYLQKSFFLTPRLTKDDSMIESGSQTQSIHVREPEMSEKEIIEFRRKLIWTLRDLVNPYPKSSTYNHGFYQGLGAAINVVRDMEFEPKGGD